MTDVRVESDDHDEPDPYKRRVAVVLALLGVLGAWVGILHNDSGNREATFARETTRTAVGSLRANVNQSTVEGLGTDVDAERSALGLAASFAGSQAGGDEPAPQDAATLGPDDREALERDLTVESERLDLKRQGLAETRVTYNNRTSQYETVLTTLAVALFLVGFTLVLNRRTRPPILVPGLLLAVYVAGWAVWIHERYIPTTSDVAIESSARAAMHRSFGEFDRAVDLYSEAIDEDDDFEPAFAGRATAGFLSVNPDFTRTLAVLTTDGEQVDKALADAEESLRLSENDDFTSLLISAVYRFHTADYDGAVERLDTAIVVNGDAPEAYLVLAAAQLARGESVAAGEALDSALDRLDLDEASEANRRYAAQLFTLLEQVDAAVPDRSEDVQAVREALATGEAQLVSGDTELGVPTDDVVFDLDRSAFADGALDTAISYEDLPLGSLVSVYVYEQPLEGLPYAQSPELARFAVLDGSGTITGSATLDRVCLPVAFRYDVHVNGRLVASLDAPGGEATC